jgi:ribosome maturation factor RimP
MELKDRVIELAEQCLPGAAFFIVDVKVTGKLNQQKVLVVADGDQGISIDDCADLSRKLSDALDAANLFEGAYHLEVSSPGADEVIRNPRQYIKNKGRRLEIINEEDELLIGKLEGTTEKGILVLPEVAKKKNTKEKQEPVAVEIPYSKIKKSTVIISFN